MTEYFIEVLRGTGTWERQHWPFPDAGSARERIRMDGALHSGQTRIVCVTTTVLD